MHAKNTFCKFSDATSPFNVMLVSSCNINSQTKLSTSKNNIPHCLITIIVLINVSFVNTKTHQGQVSF